MGKVFSSEQDLKKIQVGEDVFLIRPASFGLLTQMLEVQQEQEAHGGPLPVDFVLRLFREVIRDKDGGQLDVFKAEDLEDVPASLLMELVMKASEAAVPSHDQVKKLQEGGQETRKDKQ